jgi:hypothetical protein
MPALGLAGLAAELYPQDRANAAAMQQHVADLFALNTGTLRNDVAHMVGQIVKIPIL